MFPILSEALLVEIQEEIHHFAGWERGGLRGTKIVNHNLVNKLAFPNYESFYCRGRGSEEAFEEGAVHCFYRTGGSGTI